MEHIIWDKLPFLPRVVYSGWGIVVSLLVRPYVRPYVRPKNVWFQIPLLVFLKVLGRVYSKIKNFPKKIFQGGPGGYSKPENTHENVGHSGRAPGLINDVELLIFVNFDSIAVYAQTFFSFFPKNVVGALGTSLKIAKFQFLEILTLGRARQSVQ